MSVSWSLGVDIGSEVNGGQIMIKCLVESIDFIYYSLKWFKETEEWCRPQVGLQNAGLPPFSSRETFSFPGRKFRCLLSLSLVFSIQKLQNPNVPAWELSGRSYVLRTHKKFPTWARTEPATIFKAKTALPLELPSYWLCGVLNEPHLPLQVD